MAILRCEKSGSPSSLLGLLSRLSPGLMLFLPVVLLNVVVLGAVLYGLVESGPIQMKEESYLKWAHFYLDEIHLVFGVRFLGSDVSLPALTLASSQVGLIATWICLGGGRAICRWLIGGVGIGVWSYAMSFVHGSAFPPSESGALFAAQLIILSGFFFILRCIGVVDLKLTREVYTHSVAGAGPRQYTLGGLLLATTVFAFLLGLLPHLLNAWILLEGLGCAICTIIAVAAVSARRWWYRVVLTFLVLLISPTIGFALMRFFDYRHRWWGAGSYLPQHWAFNQYYLQYICWMLAHALLVIVGLLALAVRDWRIVRIKPLTADKRQSSAPPNQPDG